MVCEGERRLAGGVGRAPTTTTRRPRYAGASPGPAPSISGISRAVVISAAEPIALALLEDSGQPELQLDGTIKRRMQPGEALEVRLRPRADIVVGLDPERYQRRSGVKLSLLDLPFLPEEMRDLLPGAIDAPSTVK